MGKHNPKNERIKREYLAYVKEAERACEATVDAIAAALALFEASNGYRDFKSFNPQQAISFKRRLVEQRSERTGEPLSYATIHRTLQALKRFFFWLAGRPGFKSAFSHSDSEYFNLGRKEVTIARTPRPRAFPTLEQIHRVLETMPNGTDIERRNRALIAVAFLTGARGGALASAQLCHLDMARGVFHNDGRAMDTKFSKTFDTWLFPVGDDVRAIAAEWVRYLREVLLFAETDPLFPATRNARNPKTHLFEPVGLTRDFWSSAAPIRSIFHEAFERAGLPYCNPHGIRRTLAALGIQLHRNDLEALKAWSQNLGHEGMTTTLNSYGAVPPARQAEIMRAQWNPAAQRPQVEAFAHDLAQLIVERHPTLGGKPPEG